MITFLLIAFCAGVTFGTKEKIDLLSTIRRLQISNTTGNVNDLRCCNGHYGPGGDGNTLLEPDYEWSCFSCNCKDLDDIYMEDCYDPDELNCCEGHYGPGGDGNTLLDPDYEWSCYKCNCKDLSDIYAQNCTDSSNAIFTHGSINGLKIHFFIIVFSCIFVYFGSF